MLKSGVGNEGSPLTVLISLVNTPISAVPLLVTASVVVAPMSLHSGLSVVGSD